MTASTGAVVGVRRRRRLLPRMRGDLPAAVVVVALAGECGMLVADGRSRLAIVGAALPVAALLVVNFRVAAVLLAVSLPVPISLIGGGTGLNIAGSDLLLVVLMGVVVVEGLQGRLPGLGTAVKPVVLAFLPYVAWLAVILAAHLSLSDLLQTGQRLELFLVPVLVGAAIALRGHEVTVLRAYVLATTVFAALYPFFSVSSGGLGVQKNPAGQFIANAIILLIALKPVRTGPVILALPVLVLGLLWTLSRGAILSVAIAVAVLALTARKGHRGAFLRIAIPLAVVTAAAFAVLPEDAQQRTTEFSASTGTAAARSIDDRYRFQTEAWSIIHENPVFGVGIGNYINGTPSVKPTSADPHQVALLQAAEGGYPLAVTFVVMVVGSCVVVLRSAGATPLSSAAVAVLVACVGHGLVDVYWVRGTPVLGWILVGVALAAGQRERKRADGECHASPVALPCGGRSV